MQLDLEFKLFYKTMNLWFESKKYVLWLNLNKFLFPIKSLHLLILSFFINFNLFRGKLLSAEKNSLHESYL